MQVLSLILLATPAVALPATPSGEGCPASRAVALASVQPGQKNIVQTAVEAGDFNTLAAALTEAGLVEALQGDGPFTVFAPNDAAFEKLPEGTVADLLKPANRATLQSILKYHVVAGKVTAADVTKLDFAQTLDGQRVDIQVEEGTVMIDGARVLFTDIECSNGIIHVIDSVILPSTQDIVETAVAAGSFNTLAAALKAAGLVEALEGEGPFTVFAPTDAAFAALPEGTVANLLKPENKEKLVAVLKYHVVPGRVYSDQAAKAKDAGTLEGSKLHFSATGGGLQVNGAAITSADIETSNGVIHVVDEVLLP